MMVGLHHPEFSFKNWGSVQGIPSRGQCIKHFVEFGVTEQPPKRDTCIYYIGCILKKLIVIGKNAPKYILKVFNSYENIVF